MKNVFQVIYPSEENNKDEIIARFQGDAQAMKDIGLLVGTKALESATSLMYKGFCIYKKEDYPKDCRFLNSYQEYANYAPLSIYYPHIAELSIETFFVDELNDDVLKLIQDKGWSKVFIKKDSKALEHIDDGKSLWPQTSFAEMLQLYDENPFDGKFAIRKFIEPEIIEKEERYWVLNGNVYHRLNQIPEVVKEAAKRLNKLGSKYYTIDATPEFIVEVNPGESSDRHAVNSAELFASWIKKEFVK